MPKIRINWILVIASIAALLSAAPLVVWYHSFGRLPLSTSTDQWDHFGSFVGGTVSPLLSLAAFAGLLYTILHERAMATRRDREAEDLRHFELAAKSLEKAFAALTDRGQVAHSRLAWLNCARLLLASDSAASLISGDSTGIQNMYFGERSHWRTRFYELLLASSVAQEIGMQPAFFQHDATEYRSPIDERSIRVIYEFIQWPEGEADSIDSVARYTNEEIAQLPPTMAGIKFALENRRRAREPVATQIPIGR